MRASTTRRGRTAVLLLTGALAAVLAAGAVPASGAEGPAAGPGLDQVLFVANNWDGTADLVDQDSLTVVKRLDVIPDIDERMAEIRSDPERLAFFLAIRQFIGEGNDQYADDMFTSLDGTTVYVSRPSLADVVGIDLASGRVVWRFPMDGQRSDHMGISPDGSRLLVSDSTANVVHVLDPRTGQKVAEFASGDSPHESNFSRDGSRVFHASIGLVYTPLDRPAFDTTKGERFLQVVDTSDWSVDRRDLGENLRAEEGKDDTVVVDGAEERYPDSPAIRPMAVSPDETTLYLQLSFFHGYVVYDVEQDLITRVVNLPDLLPATTTREQYLLDSAHHGLAISPDGGRLCVAGTMSDYAAVVPVDEPDELVLVNDIVKPYWSTNSGDGKRCFISASGADEVVVVEYATGEEIARIPVGNHPQRMRLGVVQAGLLDKEPAPSAAPTAFAGAAPGTTGRSLPATGWPLAVPAAAALVGAAALRRRTRGGR
ncbi:MAG TPA: YncE family protein [Mycobacteriales bacterium]|nr:YncE family protein [Mycobacteriales bacterium]